MSTMQAAEQAISTGPPCALIIRYGGGVCMCWCLDVAGDTCLRLLLGPVPVPEGLCNVALEGRTQD